MSPTKQKSNQRQAARDCKTLSRQVASGGTSANAYNPTSGTFHMLESIVTDRGTGFLNRRFRPIDDVEDNASENGGTGEIDCMSNNGSYSGESEDQLNMNGKEKRSAGKSGSQTAVVGGRDKRDKVRGKNERKHQRQKERRAQELRDKCTGYLMSRKLETLSQQLVAMGFSQERATMALILNDGHVERSVAWLLEGGEGQVHEHWNTGNNPKIDISEELGCILEIEKKYKFSRPDIERAIVLCEGDITKALEYLQARNRDISPSFEDGSKPQNGVNDRFLARKEEPPLVAPAGSLGSGAAQPRNNGAVEPSYQVRRDDRVPVYNIKGGLQPSSIPHGPPWMLTRGSIHGRKLLNHLSTDSYNLLLPTYGRGQAQSAGAPPGSGKSSAPDTSQYALFSRGDPGHVFGACGTDSRTFSVVSKGAVLSAPSKEPLNMGQTHSLMRTSSQPNVGCPGPSSVPSSPAYSSSSQNHSFMDAESPSSVLYMNAAHGDPGLKDIKKALKGVDSRASDLLGHHSSMGPFELESSELHWGSIGNRLTPDIPLAPSSNTSMQSRSSSATSYGLFSGWGAGLSHSADWSTGPLPNCDYRTIDWSMNASPTTARGLSNKLSALSLQGSYFWSHEEEREKGFHGGLGAPGSVTESLQVPGVLDGWSSQTWGSREHTH